ncbi:hypothetical protein RJ640_009592 [Escallonia rubra]|uniref:F-box domain-containing protein n=1 Tax=Escallonia rubra TaxID=112253 RepID=A0AA88RK51_9ASTE|nr:hypothetical protein RJ640_009592 [Escallonia rubra]
MAKGRKLRKVESKNTGANPTAIRASFLDEERFASSPISQLPEDVLYNFLPFLTAKDVAAMAILSKTWKHTVRSYFGSALLYIDQWAFKENLKRAGKVSTRVARDKFMDFVDGSLLEFRGQEDHRKIFSLCLTNSCDVTRISQWLEWVKVNDFHEVYLKFHKDYRVSQNVFAFDSLTVLHLRGCAFELQEYMLGKTRKLDSLRELHLEDIRFRGKIDIHDLVNCCPSITSLSLEWCSGIETLRLSHLSELKKAVIKVHELGSPKIEANSLRTFHNYGRRECEIDVSGCRELEVLHLDTIRFRAGFSGDFASSFPFLKTLFLGHCDVNMFRIESHQLQKLTLSYVKNLMNATILTPNLLSLKYVGDEIEPFLLSLNVPVLQECKFRLRGRAVSTCWFLELRSFLGNMRQENVTLSVEIYGKATFDLKNFRDTRVPPMCHVKHLKIIAHTGFSSNYNDLVDGLLWSCHPETLLLPLSSTVRNLQLEEMCTTEDRAIHSPGVLNAVSFYTNVVQSYLQSSNTHFNQNTSSSSSQNALSCWALFLCQGCGSYCNAFAFGCVDWKFYLDVNCGSLPSTIKREAYRDHLLHLKEELYSQCNSEVQKLLDSSVLKIYQVVVKMEVAMFLWTFSGAKQSMNRRLIEVSVP